MLRPSRSGCVSISRLLDLLGETHQEITPAIRMLALAAPEHDRDLDLRPLVQEADDVALLVS